MSRPSSRTDRKLLETGKAMISKTGISGLSVREVCRKSGVNLGMFHYHFKTKQEFVRHILKETYDGFLSEFKIESSGPEDVLVRLKRALVTLGRFARPNRRLIAAVLLDLLSGEKETVDFVKKNFTGHIAVLLELVAEAKRKGLFMDVPAPGAMIFLAGTMGIPNIGLAVVEINKFGLPMGLSGKIFEATMLSDSAIEKRAELALRALRK